MLDRKSENYAYNLGRLVCVVEKMNDLDNKLFAKVSINPFAYLPFWMNKALAMESHNLHEEVLELADKALKRDLPHGAMTTIDNNGSYALGYYHERSYLDEKYHGIFGIERTEKAEFTPAAITPVPDNEISELER